IKKKSNKYYFSEKAQTNVFYRYGIASVKTFVIVMVIAVVIACVIIFSEENFKNDALNATNTNQISSTYEMSSDGFDLDFSNGLIRLTDEQITYYFGEQYSNVYDCIAVSEDFQKMIMVFTTYKAN